jgi:hypothetical protein
MSGTAQEREHSRKEDNRRTIFTNRPGDGRPRNDTDAGHLHLHPGNPETSRDVVNILREDGTPVTSAHITRVSRNNDNRDLALFVALNEKGEMPMMKGWFYPGDRDGYQFIYPMEQARTIARLESVEIPVAPRD